MGSSDRIRNMEIIEAGLFTILGGLIAGLIGLYSGKVQWDRQRLERTRDKLEDLYSTIEDLRHDFWKLPTYAWHKMTVPRLPLVVDPNIHIGKVNMLISLYAPKLKDPMVELESQWEIFRGGSELHQKWKAIEAIHSICDRMQEELIALSKQELAK